MFITISTHYRLDEYDPILQLQIDLAQDNQTGKARGLFDGDDDDDDDDECLIQVV